MVDVGKREDALLDRLSAEIRRADTYERMMDKAMSAIEEARQLHPDDYHLDRIERALTE